VIRDVIGGALGGVLLDALLPPSCAACGGPCARDQALCVRCDETTAPAPPDVAAGAMFGGALADAVRAAKFRPDVVAAQQLAAWLAQRVRAGACPAIDAVIGEGVDAIAFVPAPFRRRLARGFDLPALIAQSLTTVVPGAPVVDALVCTRADAPLSHGADKAARAALVQGRYRARRQRDAGAARNGDAGWTGKRLMLVDDVRTTGATLGEATRVLEAAGARVHAVTLAVAP
jgi:predicted amidophosphoribosyltransferase